MSLVALMRAKCPESVLMKEEKSRKLESIPERVCRQLTLLNKPEQWRKNQTQTLEDTMQAIHR